MMMAFMTITSIPAVAQWISLGDDDDKKVFTDLKTVHRAGNTVKIWSLSDFKEEQEIDGERFLSQEIRHAANCEEKKMTPFAMRAFRENMGNGTVVFSDSALPVRWTQVLPGSFGEMLLKMACGDIHPS